ncbi:MAG: hypothetical protein QXE96_00045 [Candidatus Caldarchaeum sp.]|jgi:hypothetical protein
MSVTLRIGDVGRRSTLYWNIPIYNTSTTYTGTWSTNSTSFVLATSGSINITGFINTLPNFYDRVVVTYSYMHRSYTSGATSEAYMTILGTQMTTYSTSTSAWTTRSETAEFAMPANGVITWELWHRKVQSMSEVRNPSFAVYLLNKNKTSITAGELDIGQLFVTGYKLDPQVTFIFDDNPFYTFYNPSTADVLVETFDTPVAISKVSINRPQSTSTAELYLIVV